MHLGSLVNASILVCKRKAPDATDRRPMCLVIVGWGFQLEDAALVVKRNEWTKTVFNMPFSCKREKTSMIIWAS